MSGEENKQPSAFDALLGELDTLTKAIPAVVDGDEKIANADAGNNDDDEDDEGKEGGDAPMAKSFVVKLEDGSEVEAQDGTELVKSLMGRIDNNEETLAKALGSAVNLIKVQGEQIAQTTALVKSLQSKVSELSGEGRGRKTVVSIHEKPANVMAKSEPEGLTAQEFMTKSNAAFNAGRISGKDLTVIDVSIRNNQAIDQSLVAKVLG